MKFVDTKNCVICRLEVCRRKELVDHIDLSVIVTQPLVYQCILIITIKNIIVLSLGDGWIRSCLQPPSRHSLMESLLLHPPPLHLVESIIPPSNTDHFTS